MRRLAILFGVASLVLALGMWWAARRPRGAPAAHQATAKQMPPTASMPYEGTTSPLKVRFEYPVGWKLTEEQGQVEVFRQVRISGPRNREDSYTAYFAVQGTPLKAFGGRFDSKEGFVKNYTSHLLRDANITLSKPIFVGGVVGTEVIVTYTMPPWHHQGLKDVAIPIKARSVFIEKSPYLYQLISSADAREYDQHAAAFDRLLSTFTFQ